MYTAPTTNTRIISICITTLLITTACLQTTLMQSTPSATSTPQQYAYGAEPESGAVFEIHEAPRTCATVTAIYSLTLREKPDENSNAIYWLPANTNVLVIGKVGAWWRVSADGYTGYAHADYLQESECE